MQHYLRYFTPDVGQLAGLGAVLAVAAALALIGGATAGRKRLYETDVTVGWAIVSVLFVVVGGLANLPLHFVAIAIAALAGAALIYVPLRDRRGFPLDLLRTTALALPTLWLAGCMMISQWDEFTQWMPNARYIFTYDGFAGAGMPPTFSTFPAYPHGLAFIIYLASHVAGHLVENASGVFNVILLAMLGITVARVIRQAITRRDPSMKIPLGLTAVPTRELGWVYCALGSLAVTVLNPTFVPKIVFTAYADTGTAVLVGMLAFLLWTLLNTLAGEDDEFSVDHIAWRAGCVGLALVAVKQVNLVLFLLAAGGAFVVALRDPAIPMSRFVRALWPTLVLPVAMYALWRLHISLDAVSGEFSFAPPSHWRTGDIVTIAERMMLIASKKGGYFAVMIVALGFGLRALWRPKTPLDRLSVIVAALFAGYTFFLLFAYIAAFGRGEALRAASYWRYNMHLGGACVLFAAFGIALLWRKWATPRLRRNPGWVAIALILAAPFAGAQNVRFDLRPAKIHVRMAADDVVKMVPPGARVAVFDLGGDGSFGVIARYVISRSDRIVGEMTAANHPDEKNIRQFIESRDPTYIWSNYTTPALRKAVGIPLRDGASHLLKKTPTGWTLEKSWPYDGYTNPYALPD